MNKLREVFTKDLSFKNSALVFLPSFAIFASAVIPLMATIDGIIYVSNAKSLFTPDFRDVYTLYREPGYPLFLKIVHFWGDAGVLLVLCQSAMMAAAGLMALYALNRSFGKKTNFLELFILWVFLANPMFLGYSGAVLQQATFTFQLAVFSVLLSFAIKPSVKVRPWQIVILTLVWYQVSIFTSIGWIYLGLFPVSLTLAFILLVKIKTHFSRKKITKTVRIVSLLLIISAVFTSTYLLGRETYQIWENLKQPYISSEKGKAYVIKPIDEIPAIPTPAYLSERVLSLMGITKMEQYVKENESFLAIQSKRQSPSSYWDTAWEKEPQASYSINYFIITNPGELLHNAYSKLAPIAPIWYQSTLVFMWIFSLSLLFFKRWKPLLIMFLIPLNFLLVYAASNTPIDRYGIPVYAFAAASFALSITKLKQWSNNLYSSFRRK